MKLTVVVLCAVLCFVDGGVAQESDWLSGTWKGYVANFAQEVVKGQ
jgi:hypothetical protein